MLRLEYQLKPFVSIMRDFSIQENFLKTFLANASVRVLLTKDVHALKTDFPVFSHGKTVLPHKKSDQNSEKKVVLLHMQTFLNQVSGKNNYL